MAWSDHASVLLCMVCWLPAEGGRAEPGRHSPPLRSSHPSPTALEIMHPDTGEGRAHAPVGPPVVAALPVLP